MTSYIGKAIVFFTIIYTLLIPSTMMNAFAEGSINHGKIKQSQIDNVGTQVNESSKKISSLNDNKKDERQKTDNTPDYGKADAIGRNIQTAGQILSSSPSELAEQAKSYALGKINNTIASEAQKWLSQSSTVKINFGFDRKGSLENNSIDLLVPLYDNKADWFFFSQLGYRNKDSRNTVNFGLGGRYFNQDWMYGLNTFYDYDITGQNRRVGLGGELWGDYIKFSTNAYHRLSDWQMSRNFEEHHERPANGYDINGEFFLSAYPNLGGKLSYGQYFGENVTLFNRQTKQRNPSQTKIGVTYTPIPLVTVGVDYKQGSGGQSETQFLTNFNLRLGVPLNTQLSPDNVASMRTLAGSRYDLVERENHIVLDHREIPKSELSVPERVVGYSHELQDISKELSANASIKQINIEDGNAKKEFISSGGDIYLDSGRVYIKFPEYTLKNNGINNYPLYISAELTDNKKTKPKQMQVIIRPFEIQSREGSPPNFTPSGSLPASGDKGFTFDPIITFDAPANPNVVKNATIDNVAWFAIPVEKSASSTQDDNICKTQENTEKLAFTPNKEFKQIKIMDDGHIAVSDRVTLMSKGYAGTVAVCVTMDGQPKKFVGEVVFNAKPQSYHIEGKIKVTPRDKSLTADGETFYTYTAQLVDEENNPLTVKTKITGVKWRKNNTSNELIFNPAEGEVETDENGQLQAKLASKVKANNVMVSLAIEGNTPVEAERSVSFKLEGISVKPDSEKPKLVFDTYTYTAKVTKADGSGDAGKTVEWKLKDIPGVTLTPVLNPSITNSHGEAFAKLTSSVAVTVPSEAVTASTDGNTGAAKQPVDFEWPKIPSVKLNKLNGSAAPGEEYDITGIIWDADNHPYTGDKFKFKWSLKPQDSTDPIDPSLKLTTETLQPNLNGELTAILTSTKNTHPDTGTKVCLALDVNNAPKPSCTNPIKYKVDFEIASVEVYGTYDKDGVLHSGSYDPKNPLTAAGDKDKKSGYAFRAKIVHKNGSEALSDYTFDKDKLKWSRDNEEIKVDLGQPEEDPNHQGNKTDKEGYLYAILKSHNAGVTGIKVQLSIQSELLDNMNKFKESSPVDFAPYVQKAKMYVYNPANEKLANKLFDSPQPNNIFNSLNAEIRTESGEVLDKKDLTYHIKVVNSPAGEFMINLGDDNKGPITFLSTGKITLQAKIKNKNWVGGLNYLYEYKLEILRGLLYESKSGEHAADSSFSCENITDGSGTGLHSFNITDFVGPVSKKGFPVRDEFVNLYNWGLFSAGEMGTDRVKIKVVNNYPGALYTIYKAYDLKSGESPIDDNPQSRGVLVCSNS